MESYGVFTRREFRRIILYGVILFFILITVSVIRLTIFSNSHLRDAKEALQTGNLQAALQSYTWSIRNYYPGCPYTSQAVEGALQVIDIFHSQGKIKEEQQGLRDVQAALYAIRSFYQPCRNSLRAIEERLNHESQDRENSP